MTILRWACAVALAFMMLSPAWVMAQVAGTSEQARGAGYAPMYTPCTKQPDGKCRAVAAADPMPVAATASQAAATSTPLTGSSATTQTVGPFAPQLGRPMNVTLSGTWTGSAQLLRSIDGGTTKTPITVGGATWASYSANANEPAWVETEAGATYYLALTLSAGTLTYRVSQ